MALFKNEDGQLQGVANNIPMMMYKSRAAYENAKSDGTIPNNVLVSINEKEETTEEIVKRLDDLDSKKQPKTLATSRTFYPNGADAPVTTTTVESTLQQLVNRIVPRGDSLGLNYVYNARDFYNPCVRKVGSFATSSSPNVATGDGTTDVGDWTVFNLYLGDSAYNFLIAVTPRRGWEIWIGCTWGSVLQGWKKLSAN